MDRFEWRDSFVVVTGGSRGIGLAIAGAASARGAEVGLIARSKDDLERAAERLAGHASGSAPPQKSGQTGSRTRGRVATAVADVSSRSELETALTELESQIGPIDVLVNNAGTGAYGEFGHSGLEELEHALSVNYLGTVYGTMAVLDLTGYFPADDTYERSFPPKVPADRVARATLRAVERRRFEVVVPAWFRAIAALQATFSGIVTRLPAGLFQHES
jgi:NAD(P)-dependent dehydrogenase (short-subunit alcohol dehydrogenase family)